MQVNAEVSKEWKRGVYQTHCKRGHEMSEDNVIYKDRGRMCKKCSNERARARYHGSKIENIEKRHVWNDKDIEILKELYPNHSAAFIGRKLGCVKETVTRKAKELGLVKNEKYYEDNINARNASFLPKNFDEQQIVKGKFVSCPVHSTAMLLMLPCKGLGLEEEKSEATKASEKRYKDNEHLIKAEIEAGKGMTRTAAKYRLCYRTLKRIFDEEGYESPTRSKE